MRPNSKKQSRSKIRQSLVRFAAVVFVCRALIPVGFMPAPFGEGGPVVLCHGGLAGAFFRGLAEARSTNAHSHMADHSAGMASEHPHADEEADATHDAWEHCPIGAAFSAAAAPQEFALALPETEQDFGQTAPVANIRTTVTSPYRARAPPAAFSLHSI
jgi:hypothetical protein